MSARYDCGPATSREAGIAAAAGAVADGGLVVLPTDTVYGVGADAFSPAAVSLLLAAKGRGRSVPPPVLVPRPDTLDGLATAVPDPVRELARAFWPGALTLVCRAQPTLSWDLGDTDGTVAVRMPLHPVALELLERTGPAAVSSANLHGAPAATTCDEAQRQLGESVAVYLDGGQAAIGVPSTIVDGSRPGPPRLLREGAVSIDELLEIVPDLLGADGLAASGRVGTG